MNGQIEGGEEYLNCMSGVSVGPVKVKLCDFGDVGDCAEGLEGVVSRARQGLYVASAHL